MAATLAWQVSGRKAVGVRLPSRADVVELVDTLVLGASAVRRGGSSPLIRTKLKNPVKAGFFSC